MFVQAVLPPDFNPYAPAPSSLRPRARRALRRVPPLPLPSKRAALVTAEVISWLAAPVGLAAFLLLS
ncbi:MAG: hypothetical protein ACODAU_12295 [Myxococcota bacterium]